MWPASMGSIHGGTRTRTVANSGDVSPTDGTLRVLTSTPNTQVLPPAASAYDEMTGIGSIFIFKKISSDINALTVRASGAEMIDGANTVDLTMQYETMSIQSNGISYDVLFRG